MAFYLHDIYTLLLLYSIIVFGSIMFLDKNRIVLLCQYIFNQKYSVLYHKKDSMLFNICMVLNLLILFSIIVSFYLSSIGKILSIFLFLKIIIVLSCFVFLKLVSIYMLALLFEVKIYAKKYYYAYITNLMFCGLFFLPIIVFVSYFENGIMLKSYSIYLSYFFGLIYVVLKIIMLQRLNLFAITFVFYNILYLCALELLPYLILFHLIRLVF